ncbi:MULTISPECIES: hypothetical protein [Corynebacterium]|uniref:hypothetical protein n=1 Tax=Corynebacterium TaxID=1716 RepID=UPI00124DDAB8|nr:MULTISPECIES: hypothetical protein [Corynebacterium]
MFKKKTAVASKSPAALRNTRIVESIDAAGFPFAAVIDRRMAQASMGLVIDQHMVPSELIAEVEHRLGDIDGLVATTFVVGGGSVRQAGRMWATFRARSKTQRKDDEEFVTELARRSTQLFNAAADAGMDAVPMDGRCVEELGAQSWSPSHDPQWPPVAEEVEEDAQFATIDGITHVGLGLDLDIAGVEEQVVEATCAIEVGPRVMLARHFRPSADDSGDGRRTGVWTIAGADEPAAVKELAGVVVQTLDPRVQLRVHALTGRHGLAVATMCGGGVLGWQHLSEMKVAS